MSIEDGIQELLSRVRNIEWEMQEIAEGQRNLTKMFLNFEKIRDYEREDAEKVVKNIASALIYLYESMPSDLRNKESRQ